MRGRYLGRLLVMSVLILAAFSCKQGTEVDAGSALNAADSVAANDPTYAEWAYEKQSEAAVEYSYGELNLAGKVDEFDVVEGDIVVNAKTGLNLASAENNLWPNATVIYAFDSAFADRADVERAMKVWTTEAGVQFKERTNEAAYVRIKNQQQGCWSNLGYTGSEQFINLGSGCVTFGTKLHEIGHSLGLNHEQSRQDRDQFITLHMENVNPEQQGNFRLGSSDVGTYDYNSVMHYGRLAFSTNGKPTIEPRSDVEIGQRMGLSPSDVQAVQTLYGTTGTAPGTSGVVLQAGQSGPDATNPANARAYAAQNAVAPAAPPPAPTTSITTGCAGFGGFDWEEKYVKNKDGTCRNAKLSCTCWRTTAGTCGLYLPDGATNVVGASMRTGEKNCDASCADLVANGSTYMKNQCSNQLVSINGQGRLEIWDYSGTNRGVISDVENL